LRLLGITLYRADDDRPFTGRELRLVHLVADELKPLIGTKLNTCRGYELRRLPPRLRQVRDLLLLGYTDKAIAAPCELAQPTVLLNYCERAA
jgi:DNA-binding NarL/FixJ family response regulator